MQSGVKKFSPAIFGFALFCIFLLFISDSCQQQKIVNSEARGGASAVAGKYYDLQGQSQYLELKPDGTFYRSTESAGVSGTYQLSGNEITLYLQVAGNSLALKGKVEKVQKGEQITVEEPLAFGSGKNIRAYLRLSAAELDQQRKAANAALEKVIGGLNLTPSSEYRFSGFWKTQCAEPFGLAIAPAGDRHYSISFCGPGGCRKPGTYRPNSGIVNDPEYQVIDNDTIELRGSSRQWIRYLRCR